MNMSALATRARLIRSRKTRTRRDYASARPSCQARVDTFGSSRAIGRTTSFSCVPPVRSHRGPATVAGIDRNNDIAVRVDRCMGGADDLGVVSASGAASPKLMIN